MQIKVIWQNPIPLSLKKTKGKSGKSELHAVKNTVKHTVADCIEDGYGVYIFARRHGSNYVPLYVGRTTKQGFCKRISQQFLGRADLVTYIRGQRGRKALLLGTIAGKPGQNPEKTIEIVEKALIAKCALDTGDNLFNKSHTKKKFHTIQFRGRYAVKRISGHSIKHPI